ncbi:MAG TPA: hypothetical protein VNZ67_11715 [bacterium]|jgi:hypothetical protein|nr:hypothetical protein [bacterium]
MATFLIVWIVAVAAALFLLIDGLSGLKESVGPWDAAAPAGHPAPRRRPTHPDQPSQGKQFQERRYHDEDYPLHRRRSDEAGGES